jgi:hypothetical protein
MKLPKTKYIMVVFDDQSGMIFGKKESDNTVLLDLYSCASTNPGHFVRHKSASTWTMDEFKTMLQRHFELNQHTYVKGLNSNDLFVALL